MKGNNMDNFTEELKEFVDKNLEGVSSGMNVLVGKGSYKTSYFKGKIKELNFKYSEDTIYDMASLTKPVVTASLVMKYIEKGELSLEDSLGSLGLYNQDLIISNLTVRQLITHTSGLISTFPLYKYGKTKEDYLRTIGLMHQHDTLPATEEYSDLNFILLAFLLEEISGKPLDVLAKEKLFSPLSMNSSFFNPSVAKEKIAPTEEDPERGMPVWGKVHDEKSYFYGGVCGHAGLFSNTHDMGIFTEALLNGKIVSKETLSMMVTPQNQNVGGMFGLGWMIKVPRPPVPGPSFGYNAFMGETVNYGAFGHTGFTGTSICIDPKTGAYAIVLSNRVYPTRENIRILKFRRRFHNFVFSVLNNSD